MLIHLISQQVGQKVSITQTFTDLYRILPEYGSMLNMHILSLSLSLSLPLSQTHTTFNEFSRISDNCPLTVPSRLLNASVCWKTNYILCQSVPIAGHTKVVEQNKSCRTKLVVVASQIQMFMIRKFIIFVLIDVSPPSPSPTRLPRCICLSLSLGAVSVCLCLPVCSTTSA